MKKLRNCVLAILCSVASSHAQTQTSKLALSIGDSVPDIEYSNVINYKLTSFRLSNFKDKLIILDFWSTWCPSCYAMFGKIDSLQQQYDDKVQFILVNSIVGTRDSAKKINAFFVKWNNKQNKTFRLPTPIEDKVSKLLFPRMFVPYYVWIRNGKYLAMTSSNAITPENIQAVLNGLPLRVAERQRGDMF